MPNNGKYIRTEFALMAFKELANVENIPTTIPRGRVDGWAFVTKSPPNFHVQGGRLIINTSDLGDAHGVYSAKLSNADKFVFRLDRTKGKFEFEV